NSTFFSLSCRFSTTMDIWEMKKRIICLPHVKGHHTGEILAHEFTMLVVVKELNNLAKLRKCLCHILNLNIRVVIVIVKNSTKCAEFFDLDNNIQRQTYFGGSFNGVEKYDKYWKRSNIALVVACFLDP
ncbi:hypothetical protein ACJX0J_017227, partial [Zea mays]